MGERYNALDASNRRIVAERGGEVKTILAADYTDLDRFCFAVGRDLHDEDADSRQQ